MQIVPIGRNAAIVDIDLPSLILEKKDLWLMTWWLDIRPLKEKIAYHLMGIKNAMW